jgi:F-type H+-transporting ATPase subunit delta
MADLKTIARPYARAAFDVATRDGSLGAWSQGLAAAAAVVASEAASRVLARPTATDAENLALIEKLCEGLDAGLWSSPRGRNFLRLLLDNDRLAAVPDIAERFEQLKTRAENKVKVKLTAAVPVGESLTREVKASLERRLGRGVEIETAVDPSLLGGAVVQADDRVIDGSIRSRLQRLAEQLMA